MTGKFNMWPFKKNKVVDLTSKKIEVSRIKNKTEETDYKDLSNDSGLGFLGNIANSNLDDNSKHLKVKVDDFEYKVDSLRKKVDAILDRLDLAEKRLDRVDRR